MNVQEFGDKSHPVIMLFPGTMCYWKGSFGNVIETLSEKFMVAVVAYTGFDDGDTESYRSVEDELKKIESYINQHNGCADDKNIWKDIGSILNRQSFMNRICGMRNYWVFIQKTGVQLLRKFACLEKTINK